MSYPMVDHMRSYDVFMLCHLLGQLMEEETREVSNVVITILHTQCYLTDLPLHQYMINTCVV